MKKTEPEFLYHTIHKITQTIDIFLNVKTAELLEENIKMQENITSHSQEILTKNRG